MKYNLVIPCSGPGTRSSVYSKFHKTLLRVGNKAVINHIIDSYKDVATVYVMLGFNENYVREYLEHSGYNNIEYIYIENWSESQFASLRQLPEEVFDMPFYLNSCDNWTTKIPDVEDNTVFFCNPINSKYYDVVDDKVFAGIGFVKDTKDWYNKLHSTLETRNDYLLYEDLPTLQHVTLDDWWDVGNKQSYDYTQSSYESKFNLLVKKHQEVYYINDIVIKLFKEPIGNLTTYLTDNNTFPHPDISHETEHAISYKFADGKTNVDADEFKNLLDNLLGMWNFNFRNNITVNASNIWQQKTVKRFEQILSMYPEFAEPINVNGKEIDPLKVIENLDWNKINNGIMGNCHGDLNLDNIVYNDNSISYIDHRKDTVVDIFYDICKLYHGMHLNNKTIKDFSISVTGNNYSIACELSVSDKERLDYFHSTELYKQHIEKINLGVGCIWLSMAPLNVDDNLNKFLFLYAIQHLYNYINLT